MDIKNKHRFNLIDVFVILVILALIAGTVYFSVRENKGMNSKMKEKNITYTVHISDVDDSFLEAFKKDVHVFNSATFAYTGTIEKVRMEKATTYTDRALPSNMKSGYTIVQKTYEDIYDVYVTVHGKAMIDERGVAYIGSQRITIGTAVNLRFGNFAHEAHITSFSVN
jgi:inhibitor of KinA sporulation pathway (predicted exonuclease)